MRTWRLVSLLSVLALVLAACGQQGTSPTAEPDEPEPTGTAAEPTDAGAGEPTPGGTLVFAGARLAASLDPALTSDGESFRVLQQVYEPLVDLAPGSTNELEGVLAESWTGEPGDTEYVFTLREGVTFHDGTPLNAEAVKINFDRMQNFTEEQQASAYYYGALMDGFGPDNLITSVEATGDLEVTFTLREPSPTFLFGITLTPFSIVSPAILESTNAASPEGTFATDVVQGGTGPFILEDYIPDDSATLARNEDYWGDPAFLDRLIIRPIADPAARLQALQGGSVQGFDLVNPADYEIGRERRLHARRAPLVQRPLPGPEPLRTRERGSCRERRRRVLRRGGFAAPGGGRAPGDRDGHRQGRPDRGVLRWPRLTGQHLHAPVQRVA